MVPGVMDGGYKGRKMGVGKLYPLSSGLRRGIMAEWSEGCISESIGKKLSLGEKREEEGGG